MPAERITDENGMDVRITWSHDQEVQIATVFTDAERFVEWARELVKEYDDKQSIGFHGLGAYWTPTRYQINQLIRHARRARDQAYGKDE